MNPRGNNFNTASFGFVYFNTNNNKNVNTSDFVGFNDSAGYSPPQGNRFSPVHYSSPNKFQKSPRNFYGRQSGGRNNFRYHNNSDNSKSFNSPSYNNNSRNKSGSQYSRDKNSFNGGKSNVSKYYEPSCMENPWAELEENLKRSQPTEPKLECPITKKDGTDVEESSSCSDDEQESESETKTSSSEVEEGTT